MTLTDEEIIRMKAVEIAWRAESDRVVALFTANKLAIETIDYFAGVDEIVEYVKTGKKPVQIKEE